MAHVPVTPWSARFWGVRGRRSASRCWANCSVYRIAIKVKFEPGTARCAPTELTDFPVPLISARVRRSSVPQA